MVTEGTQIPGTRNSRYGTHPMSLKIFSPRPASVLTETSSWRFNQSAKIGVNCSVNMSLVGLNAFNGNGQYYVSTITALDTHKIRVQSTNSTSSASLLAQAFTLDKSHKATCIEWGSLSAGKQDIENLVVAIGENKGSILLYSPLQNEVITTLVNPYSSSIRDFHISTITGTGWSVDAGQNVIEWDLLTGESSPHNKFKFHESINKVSTLIHQGKPHLLLASHTIHLVDIETHDVVKTFPGHISSIHTVLPIDNSTFITAAQGDRFINVYSTELAPIVLVTQSNVISISYADETLSAVTEDGIVEVFHNVLTRTHSTKKKRGGAPSKQSNRSVKLQRPNGSQLTIESSALEQNSNTLIITWLEDNLIPYFERIQLDTIDSFDIDNSNDNVYTLTKDKPKILAKDHSLFGRDVAAAKHYNEANATVTSGDNLRFLDNKEVEELEYREDDGPSLAEKLEMTQTLETAPKKKHTRITAGSLAVVLTQALRSNDHTLLETVLSNRDETVLKNTIERLDTSLAVVLLDRLAERIARQTNRQGQLNVWVKWIMVIHGGSLINIPNLSSSLSSLHSTLNRRANTLPRLLELQGKLDVLYAQEELQRYNKNVAGEQYNEEYDDSDVEYVEELDDHGLIDDGEHDYIEEEGELEDGYMSIDGPSDDESEDDTVLVEKDLEDDEMDDEGGYSDEEVHGNELQAEEEAVDDEQEELKKRIAKLKAKQDKRKKNL